MKTIKTTKKNTQKTDKTMKKKAPKTSKTQKTSKEPQDSLFDSNMWLPSHHRHNDTIPEQYHHQQFAQPFPSTFNQFQSTPTQLYHQETPVRPVSSTFNQFQSTPPQLYHQEQPVRPVPSIFNKFQSTPPHQFYQQTSSQNNNFHPSFLDQPTMYQSFQVQHLELLELMGLTPKNCYFFMCEMHKIYVF